MTAFGDAWLEDLGAAPPTRFGPQPAPAGPVPSAWTGEPGGSAPPAAATSQPGASAGATPNAGSGSPTGDLSTTALLAVVVIVVVGAIVVVAIRRRRPGPGTAG
jgi:hypothetical protein